MEYAARIAPEIDRLVLAVNSDASDRTREDGGRLAAELGLEDPAWLAHYAEFLLAGELTQELAVVRLSYASVDAVAERLEVWRGLELIAGPPEGIEATPRLVPLLRTVLDGRASVGRELWSSVQSFGPAADLVEQVVAGIPERFRLAAAHRALPPPSDEYLAFHQRLTTLRYVRSQAHVEAWRSHDLTGEQIKTMTALWREEAAEGAPGLGDLVARGLAFEDGSGLTVDGARMRQQIEADTNRTTEPVFLSMDEDDRENLLVDLARLPGSS